MAMKRCPVCGERYSDTYKECPFCEEEAYAESEIPHRRQPQRPVRRTGGGRQQINLITPTLIVLIVIMASLLVYLLWGDSISESLQGTQEQPGTEQVTPVEPDVSGEDEEAEEPADGTMPDGTEETEDPDAEAPDETEPSGSAADYETAMALPDGLTLSTTDFTLRDAGETATIQVSGGSGTYTWFSEDDGVASVDENGKVTAISRGTVNVVVTDGSKKGVCIVRCNVSGSASTSSGTSSSGTSASGGSSSSSSGTSSSSGLKAGAAVVVNGGNGVFVRSGPGTSYEALATVPNGADIQVIESAGDGWYKVSFSGAGGAATTGYMKGDFLSNK